MLVRSTVALILLLGCSSSHDLGDAGPEARCLDEDGDGYRAGAGCPASEELDCDDDEPTTNPGAMEICGDDVDQNCADGADDFCTGCVSAGIESRPCGIGPCAGTQECTPTGWGPCVGGAAPQPEQCGADGTGDGVDDDCDGTVDDGCVCGCVDDADCPEGAICVDCACVPDEG